MIKQIVKDDLADCAKILCSVYNNDMWKCHWDLDTAVCYLLDYFEANKFVGFALFVDQELCGAIFCHEKIWWNNSELFIDEMFVKPELQRKGYGCELLKATEDYVFKHKLAGFTLSTNRYAPAQHFYKKNGFVDCEHVLFMGKEV